MKANNFLFASTALMCTALFGPAWAQGDNDGLEEIIITAQRRVETLQEVPIAVSAFSGDDLVARGISSFNDIENIIPSLEIEQAFGSGQPQIRLRGVGFDDYVANNTPTVGIYVDEVAYPIPVMTQGILFDLQRVEVLRGPQGTLYGRNTTAGAVNFTTAKPTDELSAGARINYERFNRVQAEGFISGPLGAGFSARLAAVTDQGGGFQFNRANGEDFGDFDRTAVRGMLQFENERFTARLTAHYYMDRSEGLGARLLSDVVVGTTLIAPADTNFRATGFAVNPTFAAETGLSVDDEPFRDNDGFGVNLRLDYAFNAFTVTSLTSYETLDRREFNDWDGTTASLSEVVFNSQPDVFSQELRFTSSDDSDSPLSWIAGLYYANEDLTDVFQSSFLDIFGLTARTSYTQDVETIAVFGQADYQITERVRATFGLRYEDEDRSVNDISTIAPNISAPFVIDEDREAGLSEVTGRFALDFKLNDDALLYASISRGVKSGGVTTVNTLAVEQVEPFAPEVLWSFETGLKSEFPDQNLRVNLSAFFYEYTNQQIQGFFFSPAFGALGQIVNIPDSHIFGFEGDVVWSPVKGLTIQNVIGWKDGQFDRFDDVDIELSTLANMQIEVPRDGEDLPFPRFSYSGAVTYTSEISAGWTYTSQLDWSYRDELARPRLGDPIFNIDDYWLFNARVTVGPTDGNWDISLYGRNIFNAQFDETRNFFVGAAQNGYAGRPATWGVAASFKF